MATKEKNKLGGLRRQVNANLGLNRVLNLTHLTSWVNLLTIG